jgi:hypothetical protein
MVWVAAVPINPVVAPDLGNTERFSRTMAGLRPDFWGWGGHGGAVERRGPDDGMSVRQSKAVVDKLMRTSLLWIQPRLFVGVGV